MSRESLLQSLRALARGEHDDLSIGDDAADEIEQMAAAKTDAQRQADRKARELAAGRVQWKRWVHPGDAPTLAEYAEKLARKRARSERAGVFGGPRQETRTPDADCFRPGDVWENSAGNPFKVIRIEGRTAHLVALKTGRTHARHWDAIGAHTGRPWVRLSCVA